MPWGANIFLIQTGFHLTQAQIHPIYLLSNHNPEIKFLLSVSNTHFQFFISSPLEYSAHILYTNKLTPGSHTAT